MRGMAYLRGDESVLQPPRSDLGEAGRAIPEWEHEGGMSSALCTLCVVAQPERDGTPFANTNLGLEFPEIRLSKSLKSSSPNQRLDNLTIADGRSQTAGSETTQTYAVA